MSTYTVEKLSGCTIIRGSVPLGDMAALMKAAPADATMDLRLAAKIGATMVFGSAEAVRALSATRLPLSTARQAQVDAGRAAGLGEAAVAWIADGDRGRSSETMFSAITRVALLPAADYATPLDPSDLGRCRKLLEAVPELEHALDRMAEVGPGWARLVEAWPRLCSLMDDEVPQWRTGAGSAPQTLDAMRAAIGDHWR
jgi:hypothetical protein